MGKKTLTPEVPEHLFPQNPKMPDNFRQDPHWQNSHFGSGGIGLASPGVPRIPIRPFFVTRREEEAGSG